MINKRHVEPALMAPVRQLIAANEADLEKKAQSRWPLLQTEQSTCGSQKVGD